MTMPALMAPKVSGRELRRVLKQQMHGTQVLAATADAKFAQVHTRIDEVGEVVNSHADAIGDIRRVVVRGFWGRWRWLVTGR